MKKSLTLLTLIFASSLLLAKIETPRIFSDNMVLQSGEPVKIWGKASPKSNVEIKFSGQSKSAKADDKGFWTIYLDALKPSKEPMQMQILEEADDSFKISNILVGEVWITGGQSNMAFALKNSTTFKEALSADNSMIRTFIQAGQLVKEPQWDTDKHARWIILDKENMGSLNAVAFYFSRELVAKLNTPVAFVQTPVGGSSMCAWLAPQDLKGVSGFEENIKYFEEENKNYDPQKAQKIYEKKLEEWKANKKAALAAKKKFDERAPEAPNSLGYGVKIQKSPSLLYYARVAPIAGYTAKGFVWYQGEADANSTDETKFKDKFERLVTSWRKYWGKADMPFIFAQLPSFGSGRTDWPSARWGQYLATKSLKNLYGAVLIDLGEEKDIHPKNKLDVGKRFANLAFKEVYGLKDIYPYSSVPKSFEYESSKVKITFETYTRNLVCDGEITGFEVLSGNDWKSAKAKLTAPNQIEVESPNASDQISGVRYLWKNWAQPEVKLFNVDKLPAMPFTNRK